MLTSNGVSRPPRIALLGYGRSGKDTAGGWLGLFTPLGYAGSTSKAVCPLIAASLGISVEQAWRERHQNREYWYTWCNEYRKDDPAKLAKACLEKCNVVVGLRDIVELNACKKENLFDCIVWVSNPRVPYDKTVTFTSNDCDVVIENNGSYVEFYSKLKRFCLFGHIPVSSLADNFDGPTLDDNGDWIGPIQRLHKTNVLGSNVATAA